MISKYIFGADIDEYIEQGWDVQFWKYYYGHGERKATFIAWKEV